MCHSAEGLPTNRQHFLRFEMTKRLQYISHYNMPGGIFSVLYLYLWCPVRHVASPEPIWALGTVISLRVVYFFNVSYGYQPRIYSTFSKHWLHQIQLNIIYDTVPPILDRMPRLNFWYLLILCDLKKSQWYFWIGKFLYDPGGVVDLLTYNDLVHHCVVNLFVILLNFFGCYLVPCYLSQVSLEKDVCMAVSVVFFSLWNSP